MEQRQVALFSSLLVYGVFLAFVSVPDEWVGKPGELYPDGRLLRQIYLAKAFPAEERCFTTWTANRVDYWLRFERSVTDCEKALAEKPALAAFVTLLILNEIRIRLVDPGTKIVGRDQIPIELGRGPYYTPGANIPLKTKFLIYLIRPTIGFGFLPGKLMADDKPSEIDGGIVLVHEVGHCRADAVDDDEIPSNYWAVDIENLLRRWRDPNAVLRRSHNGTSSKVPARRGG